MRINHGMESDRTSGRSPINRGVTRRNQEQSRRKQNPTNMVHKNVSNSLSTLSTYKTMPVIGRAITKATLHCSGNQNTELK